MSETKIDERKILEWAGFKAIDNGDFGIDYVAPDGEYFSNLRDNPNIFSLDFQSKYLWTKLKEKGMVFTLSSMLSKDNDNYLFVLHTADLPQDYCADAKSAAEACLLAIMEMLNERT